MTDIELEKQVGEFLTEDAVSRMTNLLLLRSSPKAYERMQTEASQKKISVQEHARRTVSNLLTSFALRRGN